MSETSEVGVPQGPLASRVIVKMEQEYPIPAAVAWSVIGDFSADWLSLNPEDVLKVARERRQQQLAKAGAQHGPGSPAAMGGMNNALSQLSPGAGLTSSALINSVLLETEAELRTTDINAGKLFGRALGSNQQDSLPYFTCIMLEDDTRRKIIQMDAEELQGLDESGGLESLDSINTGSQVVYDEKLLRTDRDRFFYTYTRESPAFVEIRTDASIKRAEQLREAKRQARLAEKQRRRQARLQQWQRERQEQAKRQQQQQQRDQYQNQDGAATPLVNAQSPTPDSGAEETSGQSDALLASLAEGQLDGMELGLRTPGIDRKPSRPFNLSGSAFDASDSADNQAEASHAGANAEENEGEDDYEHEYVGDSGDNGHANPDDLDAEDDDDDELDDDLDDDDDDDTLGCVAYTYVNFLGTFKVIPVDFFKCKLVWEVSARSMIMPLKPTFEQISKEISRSQSVSAMPGEGLPQAPSTPVPASAQPVIDEDAWNTVRRDIEYRFHSQLRIGMLYVDAALSPVLPRLEPRASATAGAAVGTQVLGDYADESPFQIRVPEPITSTSFAKVLARQWASLLPDPSQSTEQDPLGLVAKLRQFIGDHLAQEASNSAEGHRANDETVLACARATIICGKLIPIIVKGLTELLKVLEKEEAKRAAHIRQMKLNPMTAPYRPLNPLHWLAGYLCQHSSADARVIASDDPSFKVYEEIFTAILGERLSAMGINQR